MTIHEPDRSTRARRAAELALVRVCTHYGGRPDFVLIGGLVPALLCSDAGRIHAGTTDVDVQVDLEISSLSDHAARLEIALKNADFTPDKERIWRWETTQGGGYTSVIKFELLTDVDTRPQGDVRFVGTDSLGAANLRGTGYANRDYSVQTIRARDQGASLVAEVNVTGLAGFLLAKTAAAQGRHKAKDYYDIAFVLLNHDQVYDDLETPVSPARVVIDRIGVPTELRSAIEDLAANFEGPSSQGAQAYVDQHLLDYPGDDPVVAGTDAVLAVQTFTHELSAAM